MESGDFSNEGNFQVCPTCKGKGYCDEEDIKKNKRIEPTDKKESSAGMLKKTNSTEIHSMARIGTFRMATTPKIIAQPRTVTTPILQSRMRAKMNSQGSLLPNKLSTANTSNQERQLSNLNSSYGRLSRCDSKASISETSEIVVDMIGYEEVENPIEYSKLVKAQLLSKEWSDHLTGLKGAVHLSRVEPDMTIEMGRLICRTLLEELNSLRSKCVRLASQTAKEIFRIGAPLVFRPVFDEIINSLLNRTGDSKRIIREDADEALTVIASYCPIPSVTRAFVKGTKHKNQLIRKSALRMLITMIDRIGVRSLMKTNNYGDVRGLLLEAGCVFLDDPIAQIRNSAKHLMTPIAQMPEFESVAQEINKPPFKRVEQILFNLSITKT